MWAETEINTNIPMCYNKVILTSNFTRNDYILYKTFGKCYLLQYIVIYYILSYYCERKNSINCSV